MAEPKTTQELIASIEAACEGKNCIFRGTPRKFPEVNTGLYRKYKKDKLFENDRFQPINIEKEIVDSAKVHFTQATTNVEILTDLRHFGADTTLIDFSHNLFVALFFACNGEHSKDGHLMVLEITRELSHINDIDYEDRRLQNAILEPTRTTRSRARVEFQSSVFVHAPRGIVPENQYNSISVPATLKRDCLEYLDKFHNIHERTIYNDLFGFIDNQKNFETTSLWFYQGISFMKRGEYEEAITRYNQAIEQRHDFTEAWNNRGVAQLGLGEYEKAVPDFDRAIELQPDSAEPWHNRGNALAELDRHKEAIADYDRAIRLKPVFAGAWDNRGVAQLRLGEYEKAVPDFDRAIELQPDLAKAWHNRGVAREKLGRYEEAAADFDRAFKLEPDHVETCYNRGVVREKLGRYEEAIADFRHVIEHGKPAIVEAAKTAISGLNAGGYRVA